SKNGRSAGTEPRTDAPGASELAEDAQGRPGRDATGRPEIGRCCKSGEQTGGTQSPRAAGAQSRGTSTAQWQRQQSLGDLKECAPRRIGRQGLGRTARRTQDADAA